jgi:hypothetical protein
MHWRDAALGPNDSFYLYGATDGKVLRIDGKGKAINEVEGMFDTICIGTDQQQRLLILNPAQGGLFRFNPEAVLVDLYPNLEADVSPVTTTDNHPLAMLWDDTTAELVKITTASPPTIVSLASFPLDLPTTGGVRWVSARVLGTDAKANIYVELVACNDEGIVHAHRLIRVAPAGKVLGTIEAKIHPHLSPDLPRHMTVTPDGKVMTFHCEQDAYVLTTYAFSH